MTVAGCLIFPIMLCFSLPDCATDGGGKIFSGSHAGSRLHQLIVDELVWIGSNAEFAAKRTVQSEDHENQQPDKDGQQDDLDPLQSRIFDLEKKG